MRETSYTLASFILILLGVLLTGLFGYSHFIDGDVVQILDKAHLLVTQNILIPYGNLSSSSASGNVPGPLLTLVTGLPMKLWFSPWAALAFLFFLHFLAFLMFWDVLKSFAKGHLLFVVAIIFWLNPWRLSEVFLWNPGYIYFASVLHMWSAFYLSKKPSFSFSIVHVLSLFIGLQIHPSFVILGLMTVLLFWVKALKPNIKGTVVGVLLGILILVPYILEVFKDPTIFLQPGSEDGRGFLFFGLIYVYPVLKAVWYWVLFGSNIFQTHVFHQTQFSWVGGEWAQLFVKYFWLVIKYLAGAIGVALSFYVNFQFYKEHKSKFNLWRYRMKGPGEWLALYTITAFLSGLVAVAISPSVPIYWHLLFIWPMAITPLVIFLTKKFSDPSTSKRTRYYLQAVCVYFILFNLFCALDSKKHDFRKPFHDLYFKACDTRCKMENLNQE